mmetsp:Transcript_523/g.712  ORF Transcript_523/g.712 Transcript_523/m.712 type:complete len:351 (+) Transcript_523:66-1118(+)|eukprot:CAMPEP_0201544678 /NCGR_PEP_ID=MMETSP0173_2-20130828/1296_1 /ASSEMBLY_ACC=CAM_ASM_000268 /TAXON_ID=218659 /ORGANISM="Vexillifera sp., Strain DIVA3 564/2" /LENGTH=350 /DNA_ID=CAMNT_0047952883 /DNA_START=50 /DNA_END=1102 /DNA_ORIENTATION=-
MSATASSSDAEGRIAEARKKAEEMKASISKKHKEMADTTLKDACSDVAALGAVKIPVRRTLKGHLGKIYDLDWSEDSEHVVSAAQDGKLLVWHALTTNKVLAIQLASTWVMACAYAPSSNFVAAGGLDNVCSVYKARSAENPVTPQIELNEHTGFLSCCAFLNDQNILTGSGDQTCILWNLDKGVKETHFKGHTGDVIDLTLSPDKNTFLSGGCDFNAKLWDIRSGKHVTTFRGHEGDINSLRFFPNGNAFATGSDDSCIRLWDIRAGAELMHYRSDQAMCGITSVDFTKSGRMLVAGYEEPFALVWDALSGESVGRLVGHENRVSCLQIPLSGECICTGSWDTTLKIFA